MVWRFQRQKHEMQFCTDTVLANAGASEILRLILIPSECMYKSACRNLWQIHANTHSAIHKKACRSFSTVDVFICCTNSNRLMDSPTVPTESGAGGLWRLWDFVSDDGSSGFPPAERDERKGGAGDHCAAVTRRHAARHPGHDPRLLGDPAAHWSVT